MVHGAVWVYAVEEGEHVAGDGRVGGGDVRQGLSQHDDLCGREVVQGWTLPPLRQQVASPPIKTMVHEISHLCIR